MNHRPDLLISIERILEQATTIRVIRDYPQHIAKLAAWHTQRLLNGKVIELPKDEYGVRIILELANDKALSRRSHGVICEILKEIQMPNLTQLQKRNANSLLNQDYLMMNPLGVRKQTIV